jgi:hypothetical protein
MNTPRMKEAWESPSRTADGFYLTTTPMSVYARSCYEEGCKLERELTTVTAQRDRLAEALKETISGYDVVTESIPSLCSDYVHNVIDPLLAAVKE